MEREGRNPGRSAKKSARRVEEKLPTTVEPPDGSVWWTVTEGGVLEGCVTGRREALNI
jgi:hypothetical protein